MRKTTIAAIAALMMMVATVAGAKEPPDGPPEGKGPEAALEKNDATWLCEGDGFFEDHCLNIRSAEEATTLNIKVFDPRGPQESASADPKADLRPCPNDGDADPDGTWWFNSTAEVYVCHHSGQQP